MTGCQDVARETSSATTRLVLAFVRARAGEAAVARVLELAQVPHTGVELEDPSRWVSYDTRVRLFDAVVEVLDDPQAMVLVGTTLVTSSVQPSLPLLLRALGSAAQVHRQLPRAVSQFSTTSTMTVLEATSTSATIRFQLHDGYTHSRLDCDDARGPISTVPEVFGLPRAHVVRDECQASGHRACVYHVTWSRRHRWSRGRRADDCELAALRQQLSDLQSASADLVMSDDVGKVLKRITERAAASVLAQGYLPAVHPTDGGPRWSTRQASPRPRSATWLPGCSRARTSAAARSSSTSSPPGATTAGWPRSAPTGSRRSTTSDGCSRPTRATPQQRSTC